MKAYDIALFMICFLFSINLWAASGVFGDTGVYYADIAESIQGNLQSEGVAPTQEDALSYPELAISAFGLLVRSLVAILLVFAYSTILLPLFLGMLGLPAVATAPLTMIVWMSYIIGYAQYRARSTLQGTE